MSKAQAETVLAEVKAQETCQRWGQKARQYGQDGLLKTVVNLVGLQKRTL